MEGPCRSPAGTIASKYGDHGFKARVLVARRRVGGPRVLDRVTSKIMFFLSRFLGSYLKQYGRW